MCEMRSSFTIFDHLIRFVDGHTTIAHFFSKSMSEIHWNLHSIEPNKMELIEFKLLRERETRRGRERERLKANEKRRDTKRNKEMTIFCLFSLNEFNHNIRHQS